MLVLFLSLCLFCIIFWNASPLTLVKNLYPFFLISQLSMYYENLQSKFWEWSNRYWYLEADNVIHLYSWSTLAIDLLGSIYLFSFNILMSHTATLFLFPMFGFSQILFWDRAYLILNGRGHNLLNKEYHLQVFWFSRTARCLYLLGSWGVNNME